MKPYLLLLRLNLKSLLNNLCGAGIRKENGKLDISRIALYITAGLGLAVLFAMVVLFETFLYRAAVQFGLERLLIGLALLLSMITTLLFGVFHTLGAMYFNRDTPMMAYLPISSHVHMAARWTEIYLSETLFSIALLLPILINHGVAQGAGLAFYLGSAVAVLVTPLYPLAISLLLASVLGRMTSLTRHKELWVVLGSVVMVALVWGGELLLLPQIPEDADAMFFVRLLMNNEALVNFIIGVFPPVLWALNGITGDAAMLALYTIVGVAAVAAIILLTGGSYMKVCLLHTSEHSTSKRSVKRMRKDAYTARSPFAAVFFREMNEVFKTPVYLLNGVLGVLVMPIMLIAMSVGLGMKSAEVGVELTEVLDTLLGKVSGADLTLIIAAMFSVMCLICPISSTAISREGKRLPIMKMIPVNPKIILQAKLMVNFVIMMVALLLMGVAAVIILGASYLPHVLAAMFLTILLSYAISIGNITVDVLHPVLEWKNESEAMKQNMNELVGMLVSVVMLAVVAVPIVLMIPLPSWCRLCAAAALVLLETAAALIVLRKVAEPRFARLEP